MKKKSVTIFVVIILVASFLRLYKLDSFPVSMFGDEMDVGYQAYSVLKTGNDYYGNFMPLHFHSLAEWRTPLYIYSVVPTVAIFGISPLGVRLPAAVFGILGIVAFYFLVSEISKKYLNTDYKLLATVASFLLAINPWHIQYSRAAFEVTELLFFLILGLLFLFRSFKNGKLLWISALAFALTPWVYSTAKLFTPLLLAFLVFVFRKEVFRLPRKYLVYAVCALALVGGPIAYSTVFGGGGQRFSYISVFSDPTIEHEVGVARDIDSWGNSLPSRALHNKFVIWSEAIAGNILQSYSTSFLFVDGDLNLRHSIEDMGMFYKPEFFALLLGIVYFFSRKADSKIKLFFLFWLVAGVLPSAITRDGGNHATRLILILLPLVFLISSGAVFLSKNRVIFFAYSMLLLLFFIIYQHQYWVHNPTYSERWWHYGWEEAVEAIKSVEQDFDKVVISTADEPPWIFFAGAYEYPPEKWQAQFPLEQKVTLEGFGEVSHIDKFYFGSPAGLQMYDWGKVLDNKTLYLASIKEVGLNLIREPERTPGDLVLLKSIAFPSGEPAFYLFTGRRSDEN